MNKKILLLGLIMLITIFVTGCFSIPSTIGLASVDEIDILILESFPVQINVIAKGNLPDPCTEISEVLQEKEDNTFLLLLKLIVPQGFVSRYLLLLKK
ncbi:hypothetical protein ES705_27717 [subsurface metagenome]